MQRHMNRRYRPGPNAAHRAARAVGCYPGMFPYAQPLYIPLPPALARERMAESFRAEPGRARRLLLSVTAGMTPVQVDEAVRLMEQDGHCAWHAHAVATKTACFAQCCRPDIKSYI